MRGDSVNFLNQTINEKLKKHNEIADCTTKSFYKQAQLLSGSICNAVSDKNNINRT